MLRCLTLAAVCALPSAVLAQATCCPQPTVAYSPVVAAPAPTVVQSTVVNDRWYLGKYFAQFSQNLFGANPTTTATTYAAAPAPYVAGYAPTAYNVQRTVYRPTYPATYGPVVQTVNRPVVLSPVVSTTACSPCTTCAASPIEPAYYGAPAGGCSSCAGGGSFVESTGGFSDSGVTSGGAPSLGANERVSEQRQRPVEADEPDPLDDIFGDEPDDEEKSIESSSSSNYFKAPPLFNPPSNDVARRTHPAPVRNAVYRAPVDRRSTSLRPATHTAPQPTKRLSLSGWASVGD